MFKLITIVYKGYNIALKTGNHSKKMHYFNEFKKLKKLFIHDKITRQSKY